MYVDCTRTKFTKLTKQSDFWQARDLDDNGMYCLQYKMGNITNEEFRLVSVKTKNYKLVC